jgi:hypothetical protein
MTKEEERLYAGEKRQTYWKRWGPYLSERQWGTVREDYSANGDAWNYLPHDHARSRAYRWGEDGIAGLCDRRQHICFSIALWNEKDPILKERLFGLTNREGNHGEDVKEYYYYLDATPTSSYLKYLYKYPQAAYPYDQLVAENAKRTKNDPEYELIDTGIFRENRYFDVFVEYAKAAAEDVLIRITAWNRGPDPARLHLLPTILFRNRWSWGDFYDMPDASSVAGPSGTQLIELTEFHYGKRWLLIEGAPDLLFTENETNMERLFQAKSRTSYVKDAFHRCVIQSDSNAVNPEKKGTKAAAHFVKEIASGGCWQIRARLLDSNPATSGKSAAEFFGVEAFNAVFDERLKEADEFYEQRVHSGMSEDPTMVQRQAFAGLLWNKQSYHYDVKRWLEGDRTQPTPSPARYQGRNHDWIYLYNSDVISMPDKWEYPWYASWDLAFHCVAMALIDPDYAKDQIVLFLREWYMHPNGQMPAYEWNFSDVNPPVQAWAAWRVYKISARIQKKPDRFFLERVFQKLLLNFTWWVNRKDPQGKNVFEGGFLGLDNIGVFDRSQPLGPGSYIEQSDSTSWMAMFCLDMLSMAAELAHEDPAYEDVASKFFEHFIHIAQAMNDIGGEGIGLWDPHDGFYYDVLHMDNSNIPMKVRSIVGLIPLFAAEAFQPRDLIRMPSFMKRMQWFLDHHADVHEHVDMSRSTSKGPHLLLTIANRAKLERIYRYLLDENEFLSPFGVRALSKFHADHPFVLKVDGQTHSVGYEPGESGSDLFGGNSNWRGPIWFPMNFLLIESIQRIHHYYGEGFKVECPTGSGQMMSLWQVATELSRRLSHIFLQRDGRRAVNGDVELFQKDPHWKDLILFYEYFNGETGAGLGASHQTGWTALVAKLLEQSGE